MSDARESAVSWASLMFQKKNLNTVSSYCYVLGWNCHNTTINEVTICHVSTFIKDKNKRWYVRRHEYILEALTLETFTLEAFKHYIYPSTKMTCPLCFLIAYIE